MRVLRTFVVAALMATTAWTSARAAERVDLLLVLAADVSGSMDESKFELQRSGATPVVHSASQTVMALCLLQLEANTRGAHSFDCSMSCAKRHAVMLSRTLRQVSDLSMLF
jgi:hypothetical protein